MIFFTHSNDSKLRGKCNLKIIKKYQSKKYNVLNYYLYSIKILFLQQTQILFLKYYPKTVVLI
jgi:hypothetical protein